MGSSRSQRSKHEGTFPESVKKILLEELKAEMKEVKVRVAEILAERNHLSPSANAFYDCDSAWFGANCWWDNEAVFNSLDFFPTPAVDEKGTSFAQDCDTGKASLAIERDSLLKYARLDGSNIKPKEIQALSASASCSKCGGNDCECDALWCTRCCRILQGCVCEAPQHQHWKCQICGYGLSDVIDESIESIALNGDSGTRCASIALDLVKNWISASASACVECGRLDGQAFVEGCDGEACQHHLHIDCSKAAGMRLCSACAASAENAQLIPEDGDESAKSSHGARERKLAQFEQQFSAALDLIDQADAGQVSLTTSTRNLIVTVLRESHVWLQSQPAAAEFDQKIKKLDDLMTIVTKSLRQQRPT